MSDDTERSLAKRVQEVVRELNAALHDAAAADIEAEIELIDRSMIGSAVVERIVTVRLKKVLT